MSETTAETLPPAPSKGLREMAVHPVHLVRLARLAERAVSGAASGGRG